MIDLNMEDFQPVSEKHRVLVVDREEIIQYAIKHMLESSKDIHIDSCTKADELHNQIATLKPTVILLGKVSDDAIELIALEALKKDDLTAEIPIIIMSTSENAEQKSTSFIYGASDFIVKLPDSIELSYKIRYHSKSYIKSLQLDEAYRALRVSQQQLLDTNLVLQRMMSDLEKSNARLTILANSDGLTGIANRASFDRFLNRHWKNIEQKDFDISILMIDVDHFKKFNDAFGHLKGDSALIEVAKVLACAANQGMRLAARYGGEEFCIVLPNTGSEEALEIAKNLLVSMQAIGILHNYPDADSVVTLSIGVATSKPSLLENSEELVQQADQALYLAKQSGRNNARTLI